MYLYLYLYLYLIIKSARFLPFFVRFPFALILDKNYINCHRISKKRFNPQSIIRLDLCLPRLRERSGASRRRKWAPLARRHERSATSLAATRVYQLASLSSPPYPRCPVPPAVISHMSIHSLSITIVVLSKYISVSNFIDP
jgi:hypothetical protein